MEHSANPMQLVIPPLRSGDRIEEWETAFRAATSSYLLAEKGEKIVVGLLPAFVNRRPAEVALVRELVATETSLDCAFESLRTLDPPVDKFSAMQELCRTNWMKGEQVDDFFYALKREARRAETDLDFVCSILCSQLPKEVQGKTKCWLAENTVTDESARSLLVNVKAWMVERGIPLDIGFHGCNTPSEVPQRVLTCNGSNELGQHATSCLQSATSAGTDLPQDEESVARVDFKEPRKKYQQSRSATGTFKGKCYICGGNHLMKSCPEKKMFMLRRKGA